MGPALLSAINQVYADEDDDADNLSSDALTGEESRQLEFQIKLDETMRQFWTNEEEITRVCLKWPDTFFCCILCPTQTLRVTAYSGRWHDTGAPAS